MNEEAPPGRERATEPETDPESTWPFRGDGGTLTEEGLLEELPATADTFDTRGGGNQNPSDRRRISDPQEWVKEVSGTFETEALDGPISRRGSFDAHEDGIALEHERGE